jgi:hypothetical protein
MCTFALSSTSTRACICEEAPSTTWVLVTGCSVFQGGTPCPWMAHCCHLQQWVCCGSASDLLLPLGVSWILFRYKIVCLASRACVQLLHFWRGLWRDKHCCC